MNQSQIIATLKQALLNILDCRVDWGTTYVDVVQDVREIARKALNETECNPEQILDFYISDCEKILHSDVDWEIKYDSIFEIFSKSIRPLLEKLEYGFDYYDPDTTYEEDTNALVSALIELRCKLKTRNTG